MSASLTSTTGVVAIAAAAVAVAGLLWAAYLALALRRVRAAQRVLLGEGQERDLVSHAAELDGGFRELRDYVESASRHLEDRVSGTEELLMGTIAHRALVRYDAYNEHSGKQSLSIALLDGHHSGVVLTCIHHRDQARVYAKQLRDGRSELELSPEEAEAVRAALAAPADVPV